MRNGIVILCIIIFTFSCQTSDNKLKSAEEINEELYELALLDLGEFSRRVVSNSSSTEDSVKAVVSWFAKNFDWTYTDYKKRTVQEILVRKGGNCNELARVAKSALEELDFKMRRVREINLYLGDERRQKRAEERVKENGLHMSVFGGHHNDHIWIEILEKKTGKWFPADPSIGIAGLEEWLAARFSFENRKSLDPSSEFIVAPFAIFAYDEKNKNAESRTEHYCIEGFNKLYENELEKLDSWKEWKFIVNELDGDAKLAFEGKANLHDHVKLIKKLKGIYSNLSNEYRSGSLN